MAIISVQQVGSECLSHYALLPMFCEVRSVIDLKSRGGVNELCERPIENIFSKNYLAFPEADPLQWCTQFDISDWGFWLALSDNTVVGGAAVARNSRQIRLIGGRADVAALWDIRVAPSQRRQGVGSALFRAAADWAKVNGSRLLRIETQNVNVAACRFYERLGCRLSETDATAYAGRSQVADEVMMIWEYGCDQCR